jgi:hypothetical protein
MPQLLLFEPVDLLLQPLLHLPSDHPLVVHLQVLQLETLRVILLIFIIVII